MGPKETLTADVYKAISEKRWRLPPRRSARAALSGPQGPGRYVPCGSSSTCRGGALSVRLWWMSGRTASAAGTSEFDPMQTFAAGASQGRGSTIYSTFAPEYLITV